MQITLVIKEENENKEVRGCIPFHEDQMIQPITITRVAITCPPVKTFLAEF
jgi:hypothetical protein